MRKCKCYCLIGSLVSSWYPPKDPGTSTSWVSIVKFPVINWFFSSLFNQSAYRLHQPPAHKHKSCSIRLGGRTTRYKVNPNQLNRLKSRNIASFQMRAHYFLKVTEWREPFDFQTGISGFSMQMASTPAVVFFVCYGKYGEFARWY